MWESTFPKFGNLIFPISGKQSYLPQPATTSPEYKGYPYGKLYQWGRKYGQGYYKDDGQTPSTVLYEDATYPSGSNITTYYTGTNGTESSEKFYQGIDVGTYSGGNDWIQCSDNSYWLYNIKASYDPCPSGWRVPSGDELDALIYKGKHWTSTGGPSSDQSGYSFSGVFLPAAGCRAGSNGNALGRGSEGYYWGSYAWNIGRANSIRFNSYSASYSSGGKASGYSVRCVQE